MTTKRLAVVGGGNMGAALVSGLLAADWAPRDLVVIEPSPSRATVLRGRFPSVTIADAMQPAEDAVLAVKPMELPTAAGHAVEQGTRRLLSIAAGVPLHVLRAACAERAVVVRGMPNMPAVLGEAASAIAVAPDIAEEDLAWAEGILGAVGSVVRVSEPQLDVVTALAGSGPAYLFLVAEALTDAGVLGGLPRSTAELLVQQLFVGSAAMLAESGSDPVGLRISVTSPGGTTAAGLRTLEQHGARAGFLEAVMAGIERSRELGAGDNQSR